MKKKIAGLKPEAGKMIKGDAMNILLFLTQGFEDLEAVSVIDIFGWTQYREHIPAVNVLTTGFHPTVAGRFGLKISPDIPFNDLDPSDFQALVLPGGFHSHGFDEAYDSRIHAIARSIHQNNGFIATMCVGVLPIADAGLLEGKKATTYPYSRYHDNFTRERKESTLKEHEKKDTQIAHITNVTYNGLGYLVYHKKGLAAIRYMRQQL